VAWYRAAGGAAIGLAAAACLTSWEWLGRHGRRMSKARLVITAVVIENRSQGDAARAYGVSQGWVSRLVARYRAEGEAAFEPRSRRPKTSPNAISDTTAGLIVRLRKELSGQGLDAGPDTICWHLRHHHQVSVAPATVSRFLTRAGLVVPEPRKRPKSSCIRFAAEQPNECFRRPHRSLPHRQTPATAYTARPKAVSGDRAADTHNRVRTDIIGETGTVTLRHAGKLHHIGIGRTHAGTHILLLIQDLDIRIIGAATGELLRELTLDPARNYQPTGQPPGPPPRTPRRQKNPGP
jgi:transposase